MEEEKYILMFLKVCTTLFLIASFVFVLNLVIPKKTISYAITNYEWFYDQYNTIQSMQSNIKTLESKNLSERQEMELQGMKLVLNNNISEYNSKSRQITRELFKAKDLPYQINLEER